MEVVEATTTTEVGVVGVVGVHTGAATTATITQVAITPSMTTEVGVTDLRRWVVVGVVAGVGGRRSQLKIFVPLLKWI